MGGEECCGGAKALIGTPKLIFIKAEGTRGDRATETGKGRYQEKGRWTLGPPQIEFHGSGIRRVRWMHIRELNSRIERSE